MTSFKNVSSEFFLLEDCLQELKDLKVLLNCVEAILCRDFPYNLNHEERISSSVYLLELYQSQMAEIVAAIQQLTETPRERSRRS